MSFIDFLMEYYFWIMAILLILVVGVIGFLVDSKHGKKKGEKVENNEVPQTPVDNGEQQMQMNVNPNMTLGSLNSGSPINSQENANNVVNNVEGVVPPVQPMGQVDVSQPVVEQPVVGQVQMETPVIAMQQSPEPVQVETPVVSPQPVMEQPMVGQVVMENPVMQSQPEPVQVVPQQVNVETSIMNQPVQPVSESVVLEPQVIMPQQINVETPVVNPQSVMEQPMVGAVQVETPVVQQQSEPVQVNPQVVNPQVVGSQPVMEQPVVSQPVVNGVPASSVVTSDGAQPFDINSMFNSNQ